MIAIKNPFIVISIFIWIGLVCAISFMEAWLKFRAPGITVPLGLGIGRLVFAALNKVEWVLALVVVGYLFYIDRPFFGQENLLFFIPLLFLILQSLWLLPVLDARAQLHIDHKTVAPSNIHFYYVGMELIKVSSLGIFGYSLFKYHA